jgi:hypothetical protein
MKGRKLRSDAIVFVLLVTLFGTGSYRIFFSIIESRVKEGAFAVHLQIADIGIPVTNGPPSARPRMVIDASQTKGWRI